MNSWLIKHKLLFLLYCGLSARVLHFLMSLFFTIQQEGLEEEITRRSLTYSSWDLSSSKDRGRAGWHPVTYKFSDATPSLLKSIKVFTLYFSLLTLFFLHLLENVSVYEDCKHAPCPESFPHGITC